MCNKKCAIRVVTKDENNEQDGRNKNKQRAQSTIHASSSIHRLHATNYRSESTVSVG